MLPIHMKQNYLFIAIWSKCTILYNDISWYIYYSLLWLIFMWSPYPWSSVEITPVLTTLCGNYPCASYFYVPWLIMPDVSRLLRVPHVALEWVMMLLGTSIVMLQLVMVLLGTSIVMLQLVMMLLCVHIMASQWI